MTLAGKQGKGGGPQRNILKPVIHQDTWFLRITPPSVEGPSNLPPSVRWERRKKPANAPNPARAGATMSYHKGRGILYGGVHDVEESEEGIESEFFDLLYAWNSERNRFFQLTLRRPRGPGKKQQDLNQATRGKNRGQADEEELLRNLAALETKGTIADADTMELNVIARSVEKEVERPSVPLRFEMPHPRFNTQLTVQDDVLFIFGGTYEKGDKEFTFNDMYSVDLGKLDGVREVFYKEPENWNLRLGEESDEDEEEDEEEEENDEDESGDEEAMLTGTVSSAPTERVQPGTGEQFQEPLDAEIEIEPEKPRDSRPYPRPFETLRDFFARTSNDWQTILIDILRERDHSAVAYKSIKEIRKEAFEAAEGRWWDCREEVRALEDEQEEAGIGEVVSIADRGTESSGGARRR